MRDLRLRNTGARNGGGDSSTRGTAVHSTEAHPQHARSFGRGYHVAVGTAAVTRLLTVAVERAIVVMGPFLPLSGMDVYHLGFSAPSLAGEPLLQLKL